MSSIQKRISNLALQLPNQTLNTASHKIITRFVNSLRKEIMHPVSLAFVLSIHQQNLKMELAYLWWVEARVSVAQAIADVPIETLRMVSLLLFTSHISETKLDTPSVDDLVGVLEYTILDINTSTMVKNEALDIFYLHDKSRCRRFCDRHRVASASIAIENMLNDAGTIENRRRPLAGTNRTRWNSTIKSVYTDNQNVHDATINNSVLKAARTLIEQTLAIVTFADGLTVRVFLEDTIEILKQRISLLLGVGNGCKQPKTVSIYDKSGNEVKDIQHISYRGMTYVLRSLESSSPEAEADLIPRLAGFRKEEEVCYREVFQMSDMLFPSDLRPSVGEFNSELDRRLEIVFITSNKLFNETVEDQALLELYLEMTGINEARAIWDLRSVYINELQNTTSLSTSLSNLDHPLMKDGDLTGLNSFINYVLETVCRPGSTKSLSVSKEFRTHLFFSSVRNIRIADVLNAVWKFIFTSQHKTELLNRLKEEFEESKESCSTGVLARLVNVLQGFTNDPDLIIKISKMDGLKNRILAEVEAKTRASNIDPIIHPEEFCSLLKNWIVEREEAFVQDFSDSEQDHSLTFEFRKVCARLFHISEQTLV